METILSSHPALPLALCERVQANTEAAPTALPQPRDGAAFIDLLLRDRTRFLALIDDVTIRPGVARAMLFAILLGGAAFGASIGIYRSWEQLLITAVKLPLVELVTAMLCAPALSALNSGILGRTDLRRDFVVVLSSFALATLALAGLAPLLLLARCYEVEYHRAVILLIVCCSIGGALGLSLLLRGIPQTPGGRLTIAGPVILVLLALVGTQVAWTFRPYFGRPSQQSVPLFRGTESSFFDAALTSLRSAEGNYGEGSP